MRTETTLLKMQIKFFLTFLETGKAYCCWITQEIDNSFVVQTCLIWLHSCLTYRSPFLSGKLEQQHAWITWSHCRDVWPVTSSFQKILLASSKSFLLPSTFLGCFAWVKQNHLNLIFIKDKTWLLMVVGQEGRFEISPILTTPSM